MNHPAGSSRYLSETRIYPHQTIEQQLNINDLPCGCTFICYRFELLVSTYLTRITTADQRICVIIGRYLALDDEARLAESREVLEWDLPS